MSVKIQEILDTMLPPPTSDPNDPAAATYLHTVQGAMITLSFAVQNLSGDDVQRALYFRNAVLQRLADMSDMYRRATAAGLFFSSDPLVRLKFLNQGRTIYRTLPPSEDGYAGLLQTISTLCTMLNDEKTGVLNISSSGAPRVSSLTISFEGMRGIPSSVFNADSLKRQQANQSIEQLDFSKRRARLLFVAERDEDSLDLIVGVRRMRDATGYIIKVVDKLRNTVRELDLNSSTTDAVAREYYNETLKSMVEFAMSPDDVLILRVPDVNRHSLNLVTVKPYQRLVNSRNDLFRVQVGRASFDEQTLQLLQKMIEDFSVGGLDSVTPYPFISDILYGDRKYGWMLAGLNLLSSFERGDSPAVVRSYSYLGAKFSEIKQRMLDGTLLVPSDVSTFVDMFSRSMSEHGLANTLTECLEKCGMLMFFDDREGFDVNNVTIDSQSASRETSLVSTILTAIDPVHAVLRPSDVRAAITARSSTNGPRWFIISDVVTLLDNSQDPVDVTTFAGMSRLMNIIVDSSRGA